MPQRTPMARLLGRARICFVKVLVALQKDQKQNEVTPEVLRQQKVLFDVLMTIFA